MLPNDSSNDKQNQTLVLRTLNDSIRKLFARLKMGYADWDLNPNLREAILQHPSLNKATDILKRYDETFSLAISAKYELDDKYTHLYKLINNKPKSK